ncbi:9027_t:CDS:2 [Funneliformis geosporum]|uniref:11161_t:CDS:1 n=1 Tax=Funneliformis geosporum TaxID=1117311 RepID=A0A9W4WRR1_9GLOM|nr:9027_t:CDS:2 [Funneliformis geosporum]CAI2181702.1 11161_t:CDS:2 [Funneliformis geosporum]
MERTITKDNKIIPSETPLQKPSLEEVEKKEAERLKNTNEENKPKEGGSAGRVLIGAKTVNDVMNPSPRRSNTS